MMKKGEVVQLGAKHKRYWRSNLRLTGVLLAIWFAATFGVSWFARELQALTILGFPLPFFMAAQGALLIYVVLVGVYAWRMDKLDREFGVQEEQ
ncbi:MAG: DUF4212 domain-containing protein [Sideroxydans sp.]|jgi:putative solute:sodium symporter small subunit